MEHVAIVIGDRFSAFAKLQHVISVTNLSAKIESGEDHPSKVVLGQGVTESWVASLKATARRAGANITFLGDDVLLNRAARWSSHKARRENVLITEPEVLLSGGFCCEIIIDDNQELLIDHVTGFHIQGMVLIEAARQMFLAVIERHLRVGKPTYCAINFINTKFDKFAFPISMCMHLRVVSHEIKNEIADIYSVEVTFLQNDRIVTTAEMKFTAFDTETLSTKEAGMASEAVKRATTPILGPAIAIA